MIIQRMIRETKRIRRLASSLRYFPSVQEILLNAETFFGIGSSRPNANLFTFDGIFTFHPAILATCFLDSAAPWQNCQSDPSNVETGGKGTADECCSTG